MTVTAPQVRRYSRTPRVLVVDDDRRIRELLEIALSAHGFEVVCAADGDEAVRRAQAERPDLVVLDVRLPGRSGLEVCDVLRNDPVDPSVPIILVSATAEIDQRLQGLARGADDFLPKPFSPKELVARARRLLTRTAEMRSVQGRLQTLERELSSARREARRAGLDAQRAQRLREAVTGPGRELCSTFDLDRVAQRLLAVARPRTGARVVALLLAGVREGALTPWAVHGDRFERAAGLGIAEAGEPAALLRGLGRPVTVLELERAAPGAAEIPALVEGRWSLLVPLAGSARLEGVIVAEERADGATLARADSEWLAALGEAAAVALRNAADVRAQARALLQLGAERHYRTADAARALAEGVALVDTALAGLPLEPRWRDPLVHALELATAGDDAPSDLPGLERDDASGLVREVGALLARSAGLRPGGEPVAPDLRPAVVLRALADYVRARSLAGDPAGALESARQTADALDPVVARALDGGPPSGRRRAA